MKFFTRNRSRIKMMWLRNTCRNVSRFSVNFLVGQQLQTDVFNKNSEWHLPHIYYNSFLQHIFEVLKT
jgi:phosphopantothenoylcysteine synthetase/decarboxylase